MLDQGDIVLVPVPFTDLSSTRRRPVIVLSNARYHQATEDMVVVAMTSNPFQTAYSFVLDDGDLDAGSLNHPGTVRADKIFTLSRQIIVKSFGRVKSPVLDRIRHLIADVITP